MAKIIDLKKRRSWRDLKRFIKSGKMLMPRSELPPAPKPTSDTAMALAYVLRVLKRTDR